MITEPVVSKMQIEGVKIVWTVRLTSARMREGDKGDDTVNPFLLLSQGQDSRNRICNIFSVEYKPAIEESRECHLSHFFPQ
jgi:hypothetical protein